MIFGEVRRTLPLALLSPAERAEEEERGQYWAIFPRETYQLLLESFMFLRFVFFEM